MLSLCRLTSFLTLHCVWIALPASHVEIPRSLHWEKNRVTEAAGSSLLHNDTWFWHHILIVVSVGCFWRLLHTQNCVFHNKISDFSLKKHSFKDIVIHFFTVFWIFSIFEHELNLNTVIFVMHNVVRQQAHTNLFIFLVKPCLKRLISLCWKPSNTLLF